ncbi:MAG: helix-turn-helix transcriptional regulator [Chitinophagales bacterium]|nr:helix-turn-helix domain-containing protein [Bacteroidota bacterium]MCB9044162.1 helix-turn-helix domain-containing protein [Chitinophagales bacterium]
MKKDIPKVNYKPQSTEDFGLDIVSIDNIKQRQDNKTHHSEQPHQLKFYTLIYFTQGSGRHYVDFEWYPVQKNTVVFLTKEQVHAFDFSTDLDGYCLVFNEGYFVKYTTQFSDNFIFRFLNDQLSSPTVLLPEDADFFTYFTLLLSEFNTPNTFNHQLIINSLFTIVVSKVEQIRQLYYKGITDKSKISLFQIFTQLIEKHYTENRNALFYANTMAVTYKHLNLVCKTVINKTAKNVIDDFVVLQAKRKIINTDMKSTEIAYSLGFEDPTNFTKYFKKHTGITPKLFIQSINKH